MLTSLFHPFAIFDGDILEFWLVNLKLLNTLFFLIDIHLN